MQYDCEEAFNKFKNQGRIHLIKSSKLDDKIIHIFILGKLNKIDTDEIRSVMSNKAKDGFYVIDETDLMMFDENMKTDKMVNMLERIKEREINRII